MDHFPSIRWRKAVYVERIGDGAWGYDCRLCIAKDGLRGRDVENLFKSKAEHAEHVRDFHGLEADV